MKYESEMTMTSCVPERPRENLTGALQETNSIAIEAVSRARRIREHLFGAEPEKTCASTGGVPAPFCFRDELEEVRNRLLMANEFLCEIAARLGVE